MHKQVIVTVATLAVTAGACFAQPLVAKDNAVVGWSIGPTTTGQPAGQYNAATAIQLDNTLQIFNLSTGTQISDTLNLSPFIQGVQFDNSNNVKHNPDGALLVMDFGNATNGARLSRYNPNGSITQLFNAADLTNLTASPSSYGTNLPAFPSWATFGLTLARGSHISISPDNTKIAFTGRENGAVYILDYNAAAGTITGGRQTTGTQPLLTGRTQGGYWKDNNTFVAIATDGVITSIDATTMAQTAAGTYPSPNGGNSEFSSVAYEPALSPYVYVQYNNFLANGTNAPLSNISKIFVLDPANSYSVVASANYDGVSVSTRRIAFDSAGNLYWTTFVGNTGSATGNVYGPPKIYKITGATTLANITDNNATAVYSPAITGFFSSFSEMDIAAGISNAPACYANCNGNTDIPLLTAGDFTCFLNKFRAGDTYANCNGNTDIPLLTAADFTCFLNKFRAGCP